MAGTTCARNTPCTQASGIIPSYSPARSLRIWLAVLACLSPHLGGSPSNTQNSHTNGPHTDSGYCRRSSSSQGGFGLGAEAQVIAVQGTVGVLLMSLSLCVCFLFCVSECASVSARASPHTLVGPPSNTQSNHNNGPHTNSLYCRQSSSSQGGFGLGADAQVIAVQGIYSGFLSCVYACVCACVRACACVCVCSPFCVQRRPRTKACVPTRALLCTHTHTCAPDQRPLHIHNLFPQGPISSPSTRTGKGIALCTKLPLSVTRNCKDQAQTRTHAHTNTEVTFNAIKHGQGMKRFMAGWACLGARHTHTHTHTHTQAHTHTHARTHTHTYAHPPTPTPTLTPTHIHPYTHTRIHSRTQRPIST